MKWIGKIWLRMNSNNNARVNWNGNPPPKITIPVPTPKITGVRIFRQGVPSKRSQYQPPLRDQTNRYFLADWGITGECTQVGENIGNARSPQYYTVQGNLHHGENEAQYCHGICECGGSLPQNSLGQNIQQTSGGSLDPELVYPDMLRHKTSPRSENYP